MKYPLVSVILPFYNAQDKIKFAIESIINQTYPNVELVMINNNSDDKSLNIAQYYANKFDNIIITNETQQGVVYASQKGLQLAKGSFISRMDADDIAYSNKIEKQMDLFFENPDLGVVSCKVNNKQCKTFRGDGMNYYVSWTNELTRHEQIFLNQFIESPIINPTVIIKREIIEQFGFYKDDYFPEDYELWLRYLSQDVKFAKVEDVLFQWNDSSTRLTRMSEKYSEEAFYKIKLNYFCKNIMPLYYDKKIYVWGAGRLTRKRVAILENLGFKIDKFIDIKENILQNQISYTSLSYDNSVIILSFVSNRGARYKIREFLNKLGYKEGKQYWCFA